MADIARYPLFRHLRGSGTTHVEQIRNGTTIRAGVGASFWFRPLSAVLNEVPVDDRELPLISPLTLRPDCGAALRLTRLPAY